MSKAALIDAVRHLDVDATKRLLDAKPALASVRDRQERGLLHIACSMPPDVADHGAAEQARLVTFLLDRGFEIDEPVGRDKCTPLFFAVARARNAALVKLLLARGADVNAAPGGGLFAAGWWDDVKSMNLLLAAGAEIDVVVGVTPFLASWGWQKFDAARCLALHGADVNYQDRKGRTALHVGVEREFDPAQLRWLVKHGASPDIEDNAGISARQRASRKRDKRFHAALA